MQWSLLLYPFLVHAAVVTNSRILVWAAIILLVWNILAPWLMQGSIWARVALPMLILGGIEFTLYGDVRQFLLAAPILVFIALFWLFGQTLLPGRRPLITGIARAMRGELPTSVEHYTRQLTFFWVGLFAFMAILNLLLALFAEPVVWSLFTNFVNYLIMGLVFLVEWLFRNWYLGGDETLTWRQYLRGLIRLDFRRLLP